ncbi:MAG: hypothetical protein LH471_08945, partial [Salinibacterium sp.]|nr:hypothetical protein [Salinibacterium sp.]
VLPWENDSMISADTIAAAPATLDGPLVDVSTPDDAALVALQSALGAPVRPWCSESPLRAARVSHCW